MTRFNTAIDRLADRLSEQDGRSVLYQQGTTVYGGMTGVPMDEEYEVADDMGGFVKMQVTNWIVKRESLAFSTVLPGDRITEVRGTEERVYEAQPIGNRPVAEDHDNAGVMVMIHTKRIQ